MNQSPSIAIVGLGSFWGERLAERLLARPGSARVVGIDREIPPGLAERLSFRHLELRDSAAESTLREILVSENVDVLIHLSEQPPLMGSFDADSFLESLAFPRLLNACAEIALPRLVHLSSTMAYGPRAQNPNFLPESHPLAGHPREASVQNCVASEMCLRDWAPLHPATEVTVLRACWPMGPSYFDAVVRYFDAPVVPTVLGFDPLLQFIHEEDLLSVLERAARESHPGTFNVVGRGVVSLSTLIALAGKTRLTLPLPLLERLNRFRKIWPCENEGNSASAFYDYLSYLWVADGERGWLEFGRPVYSTREAWSAFIASCHRGVGESRGGRESIWGRDLY